MTRRFTVPALLAFALAAPLAAHGGQFRGPPAIGGPGTGGPAGARSPGPRTGSLASLGGPTSWMAWWEYNKDPYLRLREAVHDPGGAAVGDAPEQETSAQPSTLAPTEATKRDVVLPALRALLEKESDRHVQTACLIAIAKIGQDHPDFEILPLMRERLTRGDQEIRETAALSLGLSRRRAALGDLVALARDESRGRKLVDSTGGVDRRTRAFAIFGLGLLAEGDPDPELQEQIQTVLAGLLEEDDREIRVATIQSLGLLQLDGRRRLLWKTLDLLWEFWARDLGRGDELVQAHVPKSVARLLGRGNGAEHARAKKLLANELDKRGGRRGVEIRQAAVFSLGALVLPPETCPEDEPYVELLQEHAQDGKDQLARFVSLVSLGQIGGDLNRDYLLKALRNGGKATEKPWAALGLGLLAWDARHAAGGAVDQTIGRFLLREFRDTKNPEFRAAAAVALGLCGYRDAVPELSRLLTKARSVSIALPNDELHGYVAIGFALMDAQETVPLVRSQVVAAENQPILLMQAAIALGVLGDKDAPALLGEMLRENGATVARLSGIASAFRFIGDRRCVDGLVAMTGDGELTKLSRAFVAAALGGVVDARLLPWNSSFSIGTNYRAQTETLVGGGNGILDIL